MKRWIFLLMLTFVVPSYSFPPAPPGKTQSGFDRLRTLIGTWKGRDSQGSAVSATFRLIAEETSLMETLVRGDAGETIIRVYYPDNGVLMLTQYGTRGNQPRMRVDAKKTTDNTLVFSMQDVTNPAGESKVQIRDLLLDIRGRTTLTESWTVRTGGDDAVETASLERASLDASGAGLERMKSLIGSWKGKDGRGNGINATYTLAADSSALMESLDIGESKENMVTVYSLSGGNTVLTHYCSMGNQPRMVLDGSKSDESTLVYRYLDATNVKSDRDPRMHDLTIRFKDGNHFSQEWSLRIEGRSTSAVYEFERVAEQSSGW